MTLETTEVRHPHPGAGPRNELADGRVVNDSVRRTSLAEQLELAERLVEQLERQRAREEAALRDGFRLGLSVRVEAGRVEAEQVQQELTRAEAEAIRKFSRTRTHEELQALRYPGYTAEQLRVLRGRGEFPMNDRMCVTCDGRGFMPGGAG